MAVVILDSEALLTVAEAAGILSLSPKTVYKMIYEGRLGSKRLGRAVRVPAADVRAVLDAAPSTARITAQIGQKSPGPKLS